MLLAVFKPGGDAATALYIVAFSLFIIAALGPAVNFLIPLYIQIVQGRNSLETAVSVIPYSLAIFAGTALIVREGQSRRTAGHSRHPKALERRLRANGGAPSPPPNGGQKGRLRPHRPHASIWRAFTTAASSAPASSAGATPGSVPIT